MLMLDFHELTHSFQRTTYVSGLLECDSFGRHAPRAKSPYMS